MANHVVKLLELLNARDALREVKRWQLPGRTALDLRRELAKIDAEIERYESMREDYIREHGTTGDDGRTSIEPGSAEYEGLRKLLADAAMSEVELNVRPVLTEDDVPECSAETLDALITIGLLEEQDNG